MTTINNLELTDPMVYPDEHVLKEALGGAYSVYDELLKLFEENEMVNEWRYYNDGKAWLCKVQKKKKTIVWMSAWTGFMQAAIYIPEKLLDEIYALDLSEEMKNKIRQTKNVGKSKPCVFEMRDKDILKDFTTVMQFKLVAK